ncbi:uncharacterized protein LY89DRAFT_662645 [Mollisia scopiformis]|uniref:Uncharacterized protein n=1 Tax=Mollisia scopiformis TaxID=149040 RepID=A0A194XVV8_MOLSC|nr:uncharacterized protein LY89DRAFT_662645 [Mollisia scopiformis]KUJ23852.1 hypothetical protein LY89DRAFT_662645 [Mollisia scopiformis]
MNREFNQNPELVPRLKLNITISGAINVAGTPYNLHFYAGDLTEAEDSVPSSPAGKVFESSNSSEAGDLFLSKDESSGFFDLHNNRQEQLPSRSGTTTRNPRGQTYVYPNRADFEPTPGIQHHHSHQSLIETPQLGAGVFGSLGAFLGFMSPVSRERAIPQGSRTLTNEDYERDPDYVQAMINRHLFEKPAKWHLVWQDQDNGKDNDKLGNFSGSLYANDKPHCPGIGCGGTAGIRRLRDCAKNHWICHKCGPDGWRDYKAEPTSNVVRNEKKCTRCSHEHCKQCPDRGNLGFYYVKEAMKKFPEKWA